MPNTLGRQFTVRIKNQGNHVSISVGKDGKEWTTLAEGIDVSGMHHNAYKGFYALRIGLVSIGRVKPLSAGSVIKTPCHRKDLSA